MLIIKKNYVFSFFLKDEMHTSFFIPLEQNFVELKTFFSHMN